MTIMSTFVCGGCGQGIAQAIEIDDIDQERPSVRIAERWIEIPPEWHSVYYPINERLNQEEFFVLCPDCFNGG